MTSFRFNLCGKGFLSPWDDAFLPLYLLYMMKVVYYKIGWVVRNQIWSLKSNNYLKEEDYKRIYQKSSKPGLFYGTAKVWKLKENNTVNNLPLASIISNIGTATYKTAKYLLSILTSWEYNTKNRYEFVDIVKNTEIPNSYKMNRFHVKVDSQMYH